ncbi:MAG: Asp23/Gls24 family envelope stress response protein [Acidaminococcus sp.]|jgi:uncharacterized alkaline shock family protein YloU|nr:Asp23/Gls24 family envelope stress response protein [Acidaminococcus sp.]MCI2099959.1 Asp23/Gls24 family envelope stress response protein [Acidaminococcus sp.]MCI2114235.1 Asp23/Gls24 family envelope stress response protein [Acidaminococcus sp.]MCI2116251.1 Asp23/Gls24 family envelope stress response protein [Acidaminococcus sp.]
MIQGKTIISDEVFVEIVKVASEKIEHVTFAQSEGGSLFSLAKRVTDKVIPPVSVTKTDAFVDENGTVTKGHVSFEVRVSVEYGVAVSDVIETLREAIVKEVVALTDFYVDHVDVIVAKLYHNKPAADEAEKQPETAD